MARRRDIPRSEIVDAAQALMESRGCNGFSLRDLSAETGLRVASLQHHFPAKADLLTAIVSRACERFNTSMALIEAETDGFAAQLERLRALLLPETSGERLSALAVTAADWNTLTAATQEAARQFTANILGWLGRFIQQARAAGEISLDTDAESLAAGILAALQGAMLLSRTLSPPQAALAAGFALSLPGKS
jgi:TetR/AcrR family transcriptional repressor of nem operon